MLKCIATTKQLEVHLSNICCDRDCDATIPSFEDKMCEYCVKLA